MKRWLPFLSLLLSVTAIKAQLAVTVLPVKVVGQKAVVPMAIRNNFAEKVESARAVVFLSDENGRVVSQSARWIIGGDGVKHGLAPGATNAFHFVLTGAKAFATTNLSARVQITRVVLEGGRVVTQDSAKPDSPR